MRAPIVILSLITLTTCKVPCSQGPLPVINGPVEVAGDASKTSFHWFTDRPATTVVEYGQTGAYGTVYRDTALVTEHWAWVGGLAPGTQYHYRVRSVDECGLEVVSPDAVFTVPGTAVDPPPADAGTSPDVPPDTVQGDVPADVPAGPPAPAPVAEPDASGLGTVQVVLEWSPVVSPDGALVYYYAEVDDNGAFDSIDHATGWLAATTWTVTLDAGKQWFWRVRATSAGDMSLVSDWSVPDAFNLETTAHLPTPVPVPVPDWVTGGMGGPVTFQWQPVEDPEGDPVEYRVQVSYYQDFNDVTFESGWIKGTTWTQTLGAQGTWFWRVQARDRKHHDEVSGWSPVQSFYDMMEIIMKGSCPFLFVRDAEGWHYQTEIQGPAIGLPQSVLTTQNIHLYRPERVVLEGMQKDDRGEWWVKLRETQREITYLDRFTLLVVDHPAGYGVASTTAESTYSYGYVEPFEIVTTGPDPRAPVSARDTRGRDVLAEVLERDGVGYSSTHPTRLVLDFGSLDHPEHARLIVDGWTTYDKDLYPSKTHVQPLIEVRAPDGGWVPARAFGNPAGDTKTMVVDLAGHLTTDDHRVRIDMGDVHAIRWAIDSVRLDDSAPVEFTVQAVEPNLASLSHAGRAPHSRATVDHPNVVLDDSVALNPEALSWGAFTRYGDVLPLLLAADDMYVIMRHGDALVVTFPDLPAPGPGMERSLVVEAVLWYKHLAMNDEVVPLPFLGMTGYPDDGYPTDAAHEAYLATWNTRVYTKP